MSIINKNRFYDGQTMLSKRQLDDIQDVAKAVRKGSAIGIQGGYINNQVGKTSQVNITVLPILYKTIENTGADSSSSSSSSSTTSVKTDYVYGKQVDVSDGSLHGPELRFVALK